MQTVNQTEKGMNLSQYEYVPVIIVVGYNRPHSLSRILNAIDRAWVPDGVQMVISIDRGKAGDAANEASLQVAKDFDWTRGEKTVIFREENQGLPDHILVCGDLAEKYGSVLIIEDDLYVSPYFYKYVLEATNFYAHDPRIAGIALYSVNNNSHAHNLPFSPVTDGSSACFIQAPCSWGQVWTREHWQEFRPWWWEKKGFFPEDKIPENVKFWGNRAWDNHFYKFLAEKKRYFVYPFMAYTTNFTESGTHFSGGSSIYQSQLQMGDVPLKFNSLDESLSVYDPYYEVDPKVLNHYYPELKEYDYVVDLYGVKQLNLFSEKYVLTQKPVENPILSFSGDLIPAEMNIIHGVEGKGIHLAEKQEVEKLNGGEPAHLFEYHYGNIPIKALTRLLAKRIKARVKG